ncbi:MAG: hypothetical protein AB7F50_10260 [Fimbriimonadaceae bacterium]
MKQDRKCIAAVLAGVAMGCAIGFAGSGTMFLHWIVPTKSDLGSAVRVSLTKLADRKLLRLTFDNEPGFGPYSLVTFRRIQRSDGTDALAVRVDRLAGYQHLPSVQSGMLFDVTDWIDELGNQPVSIDLEGQRGVTRLVAEWED